MARPSLLDALVAADQRPRPVTPPAAPVERELQPGTCEGCGQPVRGFYGPWHYACRLLAQDTQRPPRRA